MKPFRSSTIPAGALTIWKKPRQQNSHGRLNTCRKELDFIRRRERYVDVLLDLQERGNSPSESSTTTRKSTT